MDAKQMSEMLDALTGKRTAQIDPATLTDEALIQEFADLYGKRSSPEGTPNDRKSWTVRLRALAKEQAAREAKRETAKPRGRKSAKPTTDSDSE